MTASWDADVSCHLFSYGASSGGKLSENARLIPVTELSSISQDHHFFFFYLIITSQQDMEYRQGEGRQRRKENKLYSALACRCSGNVFLIAVMIGVMIVVPRLLNLLKYAYYIRLEAKNNVFSD